MTSNPLAHEQYRRNAASRPLWAEYLPHREQVMRHLLALTASGDDRLCILGAGNCNDLDLPRLLARFREVHLVDLDDQALQDAARRHGVTSERRLVLRGAVELTGILDRVGRLAAEPNVDATAVRELVPLARNARLADLGGPFECVASVCLLTQLLECVHLGLPATPHRDDLLLAIRDRHLHLVGELMASKGRALLVTDFVSSETLPELQSDPEELLPARLAQALQQRNFFTGTHPGVLKQRLEQLMQESGRTVVATVLSPWRWTLGRRVYAVSGVRIDAKHGTD